MFLITAWKLLVELPYYLSKLSLTISIYFWILLKNAPLLAFWHPDDPWETTKSFIVLLGSTVYGMSFALYQFSLWLSECPFFVNTFLIIIYLSSLPVKVVKKISS